MGQTSTSAKPEPLSPFEVMEHAPEVKRAAIERLIESVNKALLECVSDLSEEGFLVFVPEHEDKDWALFLDDVINAFRDKQWIVSPVPDHPLLALRLALPGHMLNARAARHLQEIAKNEATGEEQRNYAKMLEEQRKFVEEERIRWETG